MLIQLNAEVWMGILNWLLKYRREMAEKFAQFGDLEFSQLTQTWLHQWTRNVMLGRLPIDRDNQDQQALMKRTEMPHNITDFSSIGLRYLDSGVIQFFGKIQRFLSNVTLGVLYYSPDQLERSKFVLRHLLPLIDGIEALNLYNDHSAQAIAFFHDEFPTQFFDASILENPDQGELQCLPWLFTPKKNGQPKTLLLGWCRDEILAEILRQIRQHFMNPLVPPIRFFVRVYANLDRVEASTIKNTQGEQLVMRRGGETNLLLAARCPSDVGEEWLAQKFRELATYKSYKKRWIFICDPEIGQIDEAVASGSGVGN